MSITHQNQRKVSAETKKLIDDAIAAGMIQKVQPGAASGNEMSPATQELVAKRRREFRKANKSK